ncbi:MAG: two-component system OmpR family KDP operon response regulator KdpE [bacterium]|nr:MAG: two-component system OmpR family KDP operon response regulator KdpE [bacterium]KAF0147993.1 MAG: two-component system OmpR family KDP operon response regulator KdpE [bacterium]KAF0167531.1 MAG: two-component system OmpR family KDP operon response regulator KdpE [bacterium]TXT20543.1 MAG: two-component system OmpR family KDP operon response regulator KdpE [bacterium]
MDEPRPPAASVVVIEDEPQIRRFLRTALEAEGCVMAEADTAARGLVEAGTRKPDLIILDLGLPDRDGVEVVRDLRAWSTVPILILSARVDESDKVAALDAGADDYLTKPFGVAELLARVRALLRRRRAAPGDEPVVRFGDVAVDLSRRQVTRHGEEQHLTPIEFRLLALLIANADRVLTHRQLLREVWGPSHAEDTHYLRVYMTNLRRKLESDPTLPRHLRTETGVGYRLVLEP